MLQLSMS